MKKIITVFILIALIAAAFSACAPAKPESTVPPGGTVPPATQNPGNSPGGEPTDDPAEEGKTPDERLILALSNDNISYTPELMKKFYEYYGQQTQMNGPRRNFELRLMPVFKNDLAKENRDGLLFYIWNVAEYMQKDSGEYFISSEEMKKTADMLFKSPQYKDGDTGELYFEDGGYIPTGWDVHGGSYFRLTDIQKDDNGVYTAVFDQFIFDEMDFFEEDENYMSANMKGYRAYFKDKGVEMPPVQEGLLKIFASDSYHKNLSLNEQVTVTFELSGAEQYPLRYLSCTRAIVCY